MVDFQRYPQSSNGEKPSKNEEGEKKMTPQIQKQRICDFCGESKALVYCRADSAKLCFHCDREVHSTNPLFTKHSRSQLCDLCDSNPASIHCSTENLVLCQNCDWESHNQSSSTTTSVHDRRPLEGFSGCPSGIELSSILGFEDLRDKCLLNVHGGVDCCMGSGDFGSDVNGFSNLLVWETPAIVSFDDLIVSNGSNQNFPAMGIPPLPKNRNTVCGKYKEEIVRQLHNMVNLETCWTYDQEGVESLLGFKPLVSEQNLQPENMGMGSEHDTKPVKLPTYEVDNTTQWQGDYDEKANQNFDPSTYLENYFEESFLVPDEPGIGNSKTEINGDQKEQSHDPVIRDILPMVPKVAPQELTSHNRDSMILRYKEKRKTRRYDKHIRYESRKARAESRTRIRGRFAKVVEK